MQSIEQGKGFSVKLTIPGLPATYNAIGMKSHWVRRKNTQEWVNKVLEATDGKTPSTPLSKARCTFIRYSSTEPDFDGLVHSFKPVLDGLTQAGIITDDKPSVIGQPSYKWEKSKRSEGRIEIVIKEE